MLGVTQVGGHTQVGGQDSRFLLAYEDNGNLQSITDSNGKTIYTWNELEMELEMGSNWRWGQDS